MKASLQRAAKYFCKFFRIYDSRTETNSKRIKIRIKQDNSCLVYVYSRLDNDFNVNYDFYELLDQKIISVFTSLYNEPLI